MPSVGTVIGLGAAAAAAIGGYVLYASRDRIGAAVSRGVAQNLTTPFGNWLDSLWGGSPAAGGGGAASPPALIGPSAPVETTVGPPGTYSAEPGAPPPPGQPNPYAAWDNFNDRLDAVLEEARNAGRIDAGGYPTERGAPYYQGPSPSPENPTTPAEVRAIGDILAAGNPNARYFWQVHDSAGNLIGDELRLTYAGRQDLRDLGYDVTVQREI